MLTKEQRDKWADALESGEFQPTYGELFRDISKKTFKEIADIIRQLPVSD